VSVGDIVSHVEKVQA